MGANKQDLVDVYIKQIRCVLELAVPAWQGGLSQAQKTDLEKIQKTACHIILGQSYESYTAAMDILQLESLEFRRNFLSLKFSLKAEKNQKFRFWFKPNKKKANTRQNSWTSWWTSHEQFMKKLWTSCKQVSNKSWKSHEQVINKSWTSLWTIYEQVMNKSWTSHEQVINKLWTSHEYVMNKLWKSCKEVINKSWTSHEQVVNKS